MDAIRTIRLLLSEDEDNRRLGEALAEGNHPALYQAYLERQNKWHGLLMYKELWKYASNHKALLEFSQTVESRRRWSKKLEALFVQAFPNAKYQDRFPRGTLRSVFRVRSLAITSEWHIIPNRDGSYETDFVEYKIIHKPCEGRAAGYLIPYDSEIFEKNVKIFR